MLSLSESFPCPWLGPECGSDPWPQLSSSHCAVSEPQPHTEQGKPWLRAPKGGDAGVEAVPRGQQQPEEGVRTGLRE